MKCPKTPARLAGSCVQPAALHFWELFARKLLEEDEEAVQGGVDVTVRTEHTSRTAARISLLLPANGWLDRLILGFSNDSGSSVG